MHAQAAASGALRMTASRDNAAALAAGRLVAAATGGDLNAFEDLVRGMQRRVYGFAYQQLRDYDEAQDLTQEIFVKLYRNLDRYDAERPFEPWFWKLAANTSINYRRKRVPPPVEQPADHESAAAAPESFEHDPALVGALSQLDLSYRLPLLLHYYADLSLQQVALTLSLSVPAIKSRLHRARAILRNALAELEESR